MIRWVALFVLFTIVVTGCTTDIKNIEKMNYATAIGVDYINGQYHGYVQFINLPSVAKTTDGKKELAKVWIGEGTGNSFEESFFEIYQTAQEEIFWGHVTAIVISQEAIKRGIESIYDSISRYYEFRFTPWVYTTRSSVKNILSAKGFYDQSTMSTILQAPLGNYSQTSLVEPLKLHRLMSRIYEPGFTVCVPSLALNPKPWSINNKPAPKLEIEGAVFLKNDKFKSYIPIAELAGLRWVRPKTVRAAIPVPNKEKPTTQVVIEYPKVKFRMIQGGSLPRFHLGLKLKGYVTNWSVSGFRNAHELTDATEKAIEREIRQLAETGRTYQTDILNLEHYLYRDHYRLWKSKQWSEEQIRSPDALDGIDFHLKIIHAGTEKGKYDT
ncbi:Ger(x)C family spore germination protein [Cohnella terricola]|uniref:Ger(X)C family spore germination protein n=1 Tax=Cohnella terricola TaxID=1289167 RepID=A0A559JQ60_9BACL|nr:Ger(x)C family spore germination protein [Cohnella terricola]TVY02026.1 Ger(x)C family spore germination protein [Cohnella terricola]